MFLFSFVEIAVSSWVYNKMEVFNKLKTAVTNVLPGNPLSRDFEVLSQIASAGPGLLWKVYNGVKKTTKQVSITF